MANNFRNIEREVTQTEEPETSKELKTKYLILEILNPMQDACNYRTELNAEIVINIINSLNIKNEAEEETINMFKEMLNIISVSPHTLILDEQKDIEIIEFALDRYVYDITEPYVLEYETQDTSLKLNQRKIHSNKYRIIKMKETAHALVQMLSILRLARTKKLGIIIYADFLEVIFK